jgi:SAM-dependent methyltransferase
MFVVESVGAAGLSGMTDSPGPVELFLGKQLKAKTLPKEHVAATLHFRFPNVWGERVGIDTIVVRQVGRFEDAEPVEAVVGAMPRRLDLQTALRAYHRALPNYPTVPQGLLEYIGSVDASQAGFRAIGYAYFELLLSLIGIRPGDRVLDLGCGAGRIAMALGPYLATGQYLGLDTWAEGISWAQKNVTTAFPQFSFRRLQSPPQGRRKGYLSDFAAPLDAAASGSFDLVVSTSLFTHLRSGAALEYLRQVNRVLAPGGIAFVTAFLLDAVDTRWVAETKTTKGDETGLFVVDDTYVDAHFHERLFFEMVHKAGMRVCRYLPGSWRARNPDVRRQCIHDHQDVLILKPL